MVACDVPKHRGAKIFRANTQRFGQGCDLIVVGMELAQLTGKNPLWTRSAPSLLSTSFVTLLRRTRITELIGSHGP
jgi:hypothetical protein